MIWFGDKKRLEKKIKDLEYELSVCKADLEEVRFHYYGDESNEPDFKVEYTRLKGGSYKS